MTKPNIHFVRPLMQSPKVHDAVKAALVEPRIDPGRSNIIGADDKEYVYMPVDGGGVDGGGAWLLYEIVPTTAHPSGYQFRRPANAQEIFDASIEYWESGAAPKPS